MSPVKDFFIEKSKNNESKGEKYMGYQIISKTWTVENSKERPFSQGKSGIMKNEL